MRARVRSRAVQVLRCAADLALRVPYALPLREAARRTGGLSREESGAARAAYRATARLLGSAAWPRDAYAVLLESAALLEDGWDPGDEIELFSGPRIRLPEIVVDGVRMNGPVEIAGVGDYRTGNLWAWPVSPRPAGLPS